MPLMRQDLLKTLVSETWLKIRRRILKRMNTARDILQELLKTKSEMLADQVAASRNGRNVLASQKHLSESDW